MTVCLAALYDNGSGCVMVSDQMITAHFNLGYEFENNEVPKIVKIDSSIPCYALIAGNVVFADEVLEKSQAEITKKGTASVEGVAGIMRATYQNVRRTHIIHSELEPRGLNLDTYYQIQQKLIPQITKVVDDALRNWNPQTNFIIAGKEADLCHLYNLNNPGDIIRVDSVGYTAIGTGAPHAIYSLIESEYRKSMKKEQVLEIVRRAKERSEVAPGVGKETNELII